MWRGRRLNKLIQQKWDSAETFHRRWAGLKTNRSSSVIERKNYQSNENINKGWGERVGIVWLIIVEIPQFLPRRSEDDRRDLANCFKYPPTQPPPWMNVSHDQIHGGRKGGTFSSKCSIFCHWNVYQLTSLGKQVGRESKHNLGGLATAVERDPWPTSHYLSLTKRSDPTEASKKDEKDGLATQVNFS